MEKGTFLEISLKALSDTAGPKGLVTTLLVLGAMLQLPIKPVESPAQVQCMDTVENAQRELSKLMAKRQGAGSFAAQSAGVCYNQLKYRIRLALVSG